MASVSDNHDPLFLAPIRDPTLYYISDNHSFYANGHVCHVVMSYVMGRRLRHEACRTRGLCDSYSAAYRAFQAFYHHGVPTLPTRSKNCVISMVGNVPSNNVATENDTKIPTDGGATFSLENILGDNHDTLEHPGLKQQELDAATTAEGWDEESANRPTAEGFCVECEGEWESTCRMCDGLTGSSAVHGRPACAVLV